MSLLREGDGINFQRASYTLDGCVKIYTSRIDSVATETGKLLSGLADAKKNGGRNNKDGEDEDAANKSDGEDDEEGEDGNTKKKQSRRRPRAENTLASSYEQLEVKKLDLELTIDPLFRKMCADFDEGGAKGLLLNSLMIDKTGRIVFDGDANDDDDDNMDNGNQEEVDEDDALIDLGEVTAHFQGDTINIDTLRNKYFPDLNELDNLEICPSLPSIYDALNDPALLSAQLQGMSLNSQQQQQQPARPFIESIESDENGNFFNNYDGAADDYDQYGGDIPGLIDAGDDMNLTFGDPNASINSGSGGSANVGSTTTVYAGGHAMTGRDSDILAYFDETLKKNWAGPEHWKIQKLRGTAASINIAGLNAPADMASPPVTAKKPRQVKEALVIDFLSKDNDIDESILFSDGGSAINLPKSQWKAKNRNLLPDDRHFSSKNLIELFLRPKGKGNVISNKIFGGLSSAGSDSASGSGENDNDENFWAKQYQKPSKDARLDGDYDQSFFNDADYGGAPDMMGFGDDDETRQLSGGRLSKDSQESLYREAPTQLLAGGQRARPEYINYAKSAKRVNVKLLKDNIWSVLNLPELPPPQEQEQQEQEQQDPEEENEIISPETGQPLKSRIIPDTETERKFTDIAQELKSVYPIQQMSEISTSFCFICVLHLANEKGLVIEDNEQHNDLTIKWDSDIPRSVAAG